MNWSQIYRSEVAPILENFASGPPVWVYAIVGILAATGIALIVWAPMKVKLGGAVLIFFCGFIGFMAFRSSRVKTDEPAEFRTGLILKKYERKQVVRKTTGIMEPEITYWIDFQPEVVGRFDATGLLEKNEVSAGSESTEILISEQIYSMVKEGQTVTGVILPTANESFHFLVESGGAIVR
ncbi:MAG: hypothetical protein CMF59_08200 [Leptospiraceae bacterium]|nr:hypothetical protein [Leptospiraceae bacterium]